MSQDPLRFFVIMTPMSACILFVDGENFLHKVKEVIKEKKIDENKVDLSLIDFDKLFREALRGV